jgi:hypothetical protein
MHSKILKFGSSIPVIYLWSFSLLPSTFDPLEWTLKARAIPVKRGERVREFGLDDGGRILELS